MKISKILTSFCALLATDILISLFIERRVTVVYTSLDAYVPHRGGEEGQIYPARQIDYG